MDFEETVDQHLFGADLFKATPSEGDEENWSFRGIASDESRDVDGDQIFRKALDLSYAQERGYANWNHSQEPADQIGYLTKCELITDASRETLSKALGVELQKSATVYIEGSLYPYIERAVTVQRLLKSAPPGRGLGISVEGGVQRFKTGQLAKAIVRGVAFTPTPAQTKTMVQLRKSLLAATEQTGLNFEQAVVWVLRKKPSWTYENAAAFVKYTQLRKLKGDRK